MLLTVARSERAISVQERRYVRPDMPFRVLPRTKFNIAGVSLVTFLAERDADPLALFARYKNFHKLTSIFDYVARLSSLTSKIGRA